MNLVDKLSELTTIDRKTLEKFFKKISWCICDDVHQSSIGGQEQVYIDIEIGTIGIDFSSGDSVRYKFIPSKELEKDIATTLISKENPLTLRVEQSLVSKITNTYKDLL